MKSATVLCLVSGALAFPFLHKTDGAEKREAAKMNQVQDLVTQAINLIHQLQTDVTNALAAGKKPDEIAPLVLNALGVKADGPSLTTPGVALTPINITVEGTAGVSSPVTPLRRRPANHRPHRAPARSSAPRSPR